MWEEPGVNGGLRFRNTTFTKSQPAASDITWSSAADTTDFTNTATVTHSKPTIVWENAFSLAWQQFNSSVGQWGVDFEQRNSQGRAAGTFFQYLMPPGDGSPSGPSIAARTDYTALVWSTPTDGVIAGVKWNSWSPPFVMDAQGTGVVADAMYPYGSGNLNAYYVKNVGSAPYNLIHATIPTPAPALAAPSLSSPANNAQGVPTTETLSWSSVFGIQSYEVQIGTDSTYEGGILTDTIVNSWAQPYAQIVVSQLNYSTKYYWHVGSTFTDGEETWSPIRAFTTQGLLAPALSSPTNNATGVSTGSAVVWNAASGATDYSLQTATHANFSDSVTVASTIENGVLYTTWYPSLNYSTTYWWHVRTKYGSQTSPWSSAWSFTTASAPPGGGGGGGGGCCPYIYVQGDTSLNEENNILPQSEDPGNKGKDVSDYYKLLKPPTLKNGHYELELKEFEHERSFLDQLQLLAIDHPLTDSIAVSSDGSIIQYRTPFRLADILSGDTILMYIFNWMDGITYGAYDGKKFNLKVKQNSDAFTTFSSAEHGGVLIGGWLAHGYGPVQCQPKDKVVGSASSGGGPSAIEGGLQSFTFRERPTLVYVPLKELKNTVTIDIGDKIQIDYLNLATQVPDNYSTQNLQLVSAVHSTQGSVTSALANADGSYATLVPGESIRLQFSAPPLDPALTRSFILVSRGHYEHLADASAIEKPKTFLLGQNYPNPFNPTTTMDYQLAAPGYVSMVVYNILGEEVAQLVQSQQDAGYYSTAWNAASSPSGIYYVRMTVSDQSGKQLYATTKKLVLMK